MNMAGAAWKRWDAKALALVQADPFILAELPHYGFCHIDNGIRQAFGITDDDTRRVEAGVMYVMSAKVTSGGSTVAGVVDVLPMVVNMLGCESGQVLMAIGAQTNKRKLRALDTGLIAIEEDAQNDEIIARRFAP